MSSNDVMAICMEFKRAFEGSLSWKWDGRFETVLAEFSVDDRERVRAELENALSFVWDGANIDAAPGDVQMLINHLGGLMPGQMLFTSDPGGGAFVFCAWWPWGDGETVSIRIAPIDTNLSGAENVELTDRLKECFGISGP